MKDDVIILLAEDDLGHAQLVTRNLRGAGVRNKIQEFRNGQLLMEFLERKGPGPTRQAGTSYLLLLDIQMPKMNGIEVLERLKQDPELQKIPVVVLTTTDNPDEIVQCHRLGCSNYLVKPVDYNQFVVKVKQLGLFISMLEVPPIDSPD
ncbi:MAG: response regulator [Candidatus Neomarinimicrobiota bacterium]